MNLKQAREAKGLSQSQLAKSAGIPLRTLQALEQGSSDIRKASAETVLDLARVLECSPYDLIK